MEKYEKISELLKKDGGFAYTQKGASMLPLLREGKDVVVIKSREQIIPKKLDMVLFRRGNEEGDYEYVLHRIVKTLPGGVYLVAGDNCDYAETVKDENLLGVVTSVIRDGKKLSLKGIRYRLYANTRCNYYRLRALKKRAFRTASAIKRKIVK